MKHAFPLFFCAFIVPTAFADNYECLKEGTLRKIEVVREQPAEAVPCEVHYTRSGVTTTTHRAEHQTGYCEEAAEKLVSNLAELGWSCEKTQHGSDWRDTNSDY